MKIRKLQRQDVPVLESILRRTGVFREEEISVALELMEIFLTDPAQHDYEIFSAVEGDGPPQGYVCVGPTPMTEGTYDLYWIAVDPDRHHRGIGKQLQEFTESLVAQRGGRLIIAETSSRQEYSATRKFYHSLRYAELARIPRYYSETDDLLIFGKYLSHSQEQST